MCSVADLITHSVPLHALASLRSRQWPGRCFGAIFTICVVRFFVRRRLGLYGGLIRNLRALDEHLIVQHDDTLHRGRHPSDPSGAPVMRPVAHSLAGGLGSQRRALRVRLAFGTDAPLQRTV